MSDEETIRNMIEMDHVMSQNQLEYFHECMNQYIEWKEKHLNGTVREFFDHLAYIEGRYK